MTAPMIMDAQPAAAACASKKVAMSAALLVAGVVAISVGVAQMSTSSAATGESNLRSGFELSGDSLDALREACDFGEERFCWQYTDRADCPRDDDKGCKWVTDSETDTSSCEPKNACVCFEMPVNTCEAKSDEETCTQFDACTWSGGACSTKPGCVDFQGSTPTPAPTSLADLCVFGASVNKYCWMHDTSEICLSKTGCEWLNDKDGCTSIDECVCYDSPQAGCVQKGDEEKCMQFRGCDWVDGACASIADCDSGSQGGGGGGGGDGEPPVAEECDFGEDVQFCHQHNTASKCRTPDGCKWMEVDGDGSEDPIEYCTSINSCVCEDLPINGCDAKDAENCGKFRGCIWEGESCARLADCAPDSGGQGESAAPTPSPTSLADLCVFGASVNKYCWMHDTSEICLSKTGCEWLNDEDGCTSIDECVCYDSPQAGCVQKGDEEKCMQFRGCDWVDGACASIADCDSGSQGGGGGDGEPPVAEECDFGEDVQFCHQHNTASKCRTPDGCKWMQTEGEVDYCTSINSCVCEDLPINGCDAKDEENCGKFRGCIWEGDSCARVSECSTSAAPSSSPTAAPTVEDALPNPPSPPSSSPSTSPTSAPSGAPTGAPTGAAPTAAPSIWPTLSPSASPTITDIQPQPPMSPTVSPSASPTGAPSVSKPGWG